MPVRARARYNAVMRSVLALSLSWLVACAVADTPEAVEREVTHSLLAPCCWRESVAIHESEIAAQLRAEIHRRVERGDAAAAIEADLVRRYGERIRVEPASWRTGALMAVPAIAGLLLLASLGRRRRMRSPATAVPPTPSAVTQRHLDQLDDELAALDV